MGRFLATLADVLAVARALVELRGALVDRPRPGRGAGLDGGERDGAPAPVVLAPVDESAGEPLREPG